jgi:hypothetical protein
MASKNILLTVLIPVTVALLVGCYFMYREESVEGFQTQRYTVNDLDINLCPSFATEIQTSKGSTDCCQGDMVDGKCNGTTFCTKSPAYPGVKACVDKWREYFKEKGDTLCPTTMPNYFEDVMKKGAVKGCSAGPIVVDGSLPKDGSARQCKVYDSEQENKTKADSCYIEKMRARIRCPVVNNQSPTALLNRMWWKDNSLFAFFTCDYPFELGMPDKCWDRTSIESYFDQAIPNWRTQQFYMDWLNKHTCGNYINLRNASREEANRLQAEKAAREAAERARREEEDRRRKAEEDARKKADEASRLQQQLDEANRRLRNCKK